MGRVLVTGGAGFIGSHLVDALAASGEEVVVLDSLVPQVHAGNPAYRNPAARYIQGDVRDREAISSALEGAETVYHLASAVGVSQSMYQVADYVGQNSLGTAVLLQQLVDSKQKLHRLVVASSMVLYGEGSSRCPEHGVVFPPLRGKDQFERHVWELTCPQCGSPVTPVPTGEDKPLNPSTVYAITKRDQEELCLSVGRAYGIPVVALRFFNVFGPRQALGNPYTGVCAIFQSRLQNGHLPVLFEDGRQSRDFVYVTDVVRALRLAAEKPGAVGRAINVGSGTAVTVHEIARLLMDHFGRSEPVPPSSGYRAGDVRHCTADTRRAKEVLEFEARVPFPEGLAAFLNWSGGQKAVDRADVAQEELARYGLLGR